MDLNELYETRMLVFMETAPQSNKYRQVWLTHEQFKEVSKNISTLVKVDENNPNKEIREIELSDEVYPLPDLNSVNDKKYENNNFKR